jgi:hypothetical protein
MKSLIAKVMRLFAEFILSEAEGIRVTTVRER